MGFMRRIGLVARHAWKASGIVRSGCVVRCVRMVRIGLFVARYGHG